MWRSVLSTFLVNERHVQTMDQHFNIGVGTSFNISFFGSIAAFHGVFRDALPFVTDNDMMSVAVNPTPVVYLLGLNRSHFNSTRNVSTMSKALLYAA